MPLAAEKSKGSVRAWLGPIPNLEAGRSTLGVGTKPGVCPVYTTTSHIHERIREIMVWFSAVVRHSGVRAAAKAKRMHDVRRQLDVKSARTLCQDKW